MHIFASDHPVYRHLTGEPVELLYPILISDAELASYGPCFMVETTKGHQFEAYRSELEFWYQCP